VENMFIIATMINTPRNITVTINGQVDWEGFSGVLESTKIPAHTPKFVVFGKVILLEILLVIKSKTVIQCLVPKS